jgi:hypothetical protein
LDLFKRFQTEAKNGSVDDFLAVLPSKKELLILTKKLRNIAEHTTELAQLAGFAEDAQNKEKG